MNIELWRQVVGEFPVEKFTNYREFLRALYGGMKQLSDRYSYDRFSESLGLGKCNASWLIVTGRRKLTSASLVKIKKSLSYSGPRAKYLFYLVKHQNSRSVVEKDRYFNLLVGTRNIIVTNDVSQAQLSYLMEWYHTVIREMCSFSEFYSDSKWINSKLYGRLSSSEIKRSIALLENLGLIKYSNARRQYITTQKQIRPDRDIVRIGRVGYHLKMMEIATQALTKVPAARRDFNSLTVSVSENKLGQLKSILQKACEDIMQLETNETQPDQVFQINTQLFPFTKD